MASDVFPLRSGCRLALLLVMVQIQARADQIVYNDALQNSWQNWSWAAVNLANTSPTHNGSADCISVSATNYQALYLHHAMQDSSVLSNLVFWINGGSSGGQSLQVQATRNGTSQTNTVVLIPLPANSWQQEIISLAALGVSNVLDFDGFWIQSHSGGLAPTFYVDDISLLTNAIIVPATNAPVAVTVDVQRNRHPISPQIYGVAFASSNDLSSLNFTMNRSGGNSETRYNWQLNAHNHAADWYFESIDDGDATPGATADDFVANSKNGGAQPMMTIPMIGWMPKLAAGRGKLASYSIAKYGLQAANDWQWMPDAGNGIVTNTSIHMTNNNPNDASFLTNSAFQSGYVQHLIGHWGNSSNGGVRYYFMDNEETLWFSTHQDVHPVGTTMTEIRDTFFDYASMVKSNDPNALVLGPEEWGWSGYFYSGYDQQNPGFTDRAANGGWDYSPWLLNQIHQHDTNSGVRLLDYFTLHCYPQGGETGNDVSSSMQLLRNKSTRQFWDTNYVDQSWIGQQPTNNILMLIPRMKNWVTNNYPGTKIGITEYNWGAETSIGGATAQADILGIFGREGLDLATRWTTPASNTPTFLSMKMFRNYDGSKSTFGNTSVSAAAPNPDDLSAFAAVRTNDSALTVIVVSKVLTGVTPFSLAVTNFADSGTAQVWQMTNNAIIRLTDVFYSGGVLSNTLPPQSITLFILPTAKNVRLRRGTNASPSQMEVWLDGQGGQSYTLQSSADLKTWSPVNTNRLATNSFRFLLSTMNATKMFYRGALNLP